MDTLATRTSAAPRLPRALIWALAGSLLASAWALWWPTESAAVIQSSVPDAPRRVAPSASSALSERVPGVSAPVTANSERPTLSPPSRDPFNITPSAPLEAQVKAAPVQTREERASQPQAPSAPPMNHVVIGRFLSPAGQRLIFLQDGTQTAVAEPGVALSSGYVIETVTPKEVRLRHPLAEQAVSLPLPDDNAP